VAAWLAEAVVVEAERSNEADLFEALHCTLGWIRPTGHRCQQVVVVNRKPLLQRHQTCHRQVRPLA